MPVRRIPRSLPSAELDPAVQGVIVPAGVDRIVQLEAEHDSIHTEAMASALANRWQTAELHAGELAAGRFQRELARLVGKDHAHVGRMARVWREHGGDQVTNPYSFRGYYQLTKEAAAEPDPVWFEGYPYGRECLTCYAVVPDACPSCGAAEPPPPKTSRREDD